MNQTYKEALSEIVYGAKFLALGREPTADDKLPKSGWVGFVDVASQAWVTSRIVQKQILDAERETAQAITQALDVGQQDAQRKAQAEKQIEHSAERRRLDAEDDADLAAIIKPTGVVERPENLQADKVA